MLYGANGYTGRLILSRALEVGEEEVAVRAVFDDAVAGFFEAHEGVCAAAAGHEGLYWKAGRRVSTEDIESFVRDGLQLVERLRHSTGPSL